MEVEVKMDKMSAVWVGVQTLLIARSWDGLRGDAITGEGKREDGGEGSGRLRMYEGLGC